MRRPERDGTSVARQPRTGPRGAVAVDLTDVDALDRAWELAINPDGAHVYVVARNEDALAAFTRGNVYVVFRSDGDKRCMRFDGIPGRDGTDGKRSFAGPSARPQICPPSSVLP